MKLSRTSQAGLLFLFLGIALYGGWLFWWNTRITIPVDMPVSMSPGHIRTPEFKVNLEAVYFVEISADKNKFPRDTLHCLLGYKYLDSDCAETPAVVKASWVLSSNGQVVAHGSSDGPGGGAVMKDTITRAIGTFDSEKGCPYILDVDILGDGGKLAQGNPHLKVELFPYSFSALDWAPATIFFVSATLELIAIILLTISGIKRWRLRKSEAASV